MSYAPCGCWIGAWWDTVPPYVCDFHKCGQYGHPWPVTTPIRVTTTTGTAAATTLSDADVERIARRVAELIKEGK